MNKHVPVLLEPVLKEFDASIEKKDFIVAIDCTLGQAGHSYEIFKKISKGVLISIDLDRETIEWVHNFLSETYNLKFSDISDESLFGYKFENENLAWYLVQSDFSDFDSVLSKIGIANANFILADLGFSNYQLQLNRGISFDRPGQRLDMRYESVQNLKLTNPNVQQDLDVSTLSAAEILNTFNKEQLSRIFIELGQIEFPNKLVGDIIAARKIKTFEYVRDILYILNKPKYPKSIKYKFFQALRSFVNNENERLLKLIETSKQKLSEDGKLLVITFNSIEEGIIKQNATNVQEIEPEITELIKNNQSRSAKLYIYKKASY